MKPSLSIVLPVHNVEERLVRQVTDLLDVLPELTREFEVLVVDDGSTDDTAHVARDLALCYPQVRVVGHPIHLGYAEAVQTGFDLTEHELVLIADEQLGLGVDDLARLWQFRNDRELVIARQPRIDRANAEAGLLRRLFGKTQRGTAGSQVGGVHLVRREAFEELRAVETAKATGSHRLDRGATARRPKLIDRIKHFAVSE